MMNMRWPVAYQVIDTLERAGFEAYVVGGAVRDFVRGVHANDVDVTTSATPNEVKQLFKHTIDVGIEHGTVLVVLEDTIEVTTFRSEDTYSDFRRPDKVNFVRSLKEDLQRRDFTMNAMALTKTDELIDYFEGSVDIEREKIRAVGNPTKRFSEDALRMLRSIRFSAQLNFSIDSPTLQAIEQVHHLIENVSMERVKVELEKIWLSKNPYKGITGFVDSKLASNFPGEWKLHLDKWKAFYAFGQSANGWAYFALLQETEDVGTLLNKYKCSNLEKKHVKQLMLAVEQLKKGYWTTYELFQHDLEILKIAVCYSKTVINQPITYTDEQLHELKSSIPIATPKDVKVSGHDLMEWKSQKRGPWIREALEQITILIVNGKLKNERETIKDWFLHEDDY